MFTLAQHIIHHEILGVTSGGGGGGGTVTGSGAENYLPRWDATGTNLVDSHVKDDGTYVHIFNAALTFSGRLNASVLSATRTYDLPDNSGVIALTSDLGSFTSGTGTTNFIPKFTGAYAIGQSLIEEDGADVIIHDSSLTVSATLGLSGLTTDQDFAFPDNSGTFALTSDLSGFLTAADIGVTVQGWDADLDAIAALGSTGFAVRTGTDTWAQRAITVTAPITISNGDGVLGNPLIGVTGLSGTNTGDVTLAGSPDYITIAGQVITRNLIDLDNSPTAHVTGILRAVNGGTGFASYAVGDTLYADTTTTLAKRTIGANGTVYFAAAGVPTWATLATAGIVGGSGTFNQVAKWGISGDVLGDSHITDSGDQIFMFTSPAGDYDGVSFTLATSGSGGILGVSADAVSGAATPGGGWTLTSGIGFGAGQGGIFTLAAGAGGVDGPGGSFELHGGSAGGGNNDGGRVLLAPGTKGGSGAQGMVWVQDATSGLSAKFDTASIASSSKTFGFPNLSGTIALTSDLAAYQPLDADLTSWAAITRASGFDTFVATPTSANLKALVTDELGSASGKLIFAEGTLAITAAKTLTATNSITLSGTDSTTMTFPTTTATIARTDAAQTFTGVQTFSSQDVHTLGIDLSTSGRVNSQVADAAAAISILLQPSVALTAGTGVDRWTHVMKDSAGNVRFSIAQNGAISLFSEQAAANGIVALAGTAATTMTYGMFFSPTWSATSGGSVAGVTQAYVGGYFAPTDAAATNVAANLIGGVFTNLSVQNSTDGGTTSHSHAGIYGGVFKAIGTWASGSKATTHTAAAGWRVLGSAGAKNQTVTDMYGGYVENPGTATGYVITNAYGMRIEQHTIGATINNGMFFDNASTGYKAIAIRDQNAWIGSDAAGELTIGGTTFQNKTTNVGFYSVAAVARPAAYTQTYATATRTHANPTGVTLTDNTTGTANNTLEALTSGTVYATDVAAIRNNFADLAAAVNKLVADMANIKQVVNQVIDDGQAVGLLQ